MKLNIKDIKIHKRIRKSPGNVEGLKISLQMVGLINPILVDEKNNLIAGYRRLTAAKDLGWEKIDVNVAIGKNKRELLDIEAEENFNRLNFTAEEYNEYVRHRRELTENKCFLMRFFDWIIEKLRDLFSSDIEY